MKTMRSGLKQGHRDKEIIKTWLYRPHLMSIGILSKGQVAHLLEKHIPLACSNNQIR
jgi:hypothetical protein